ncbi:PH domain-containing protein [Dermatophilus congolensis]|uniref:Protein of uncharacterized function (DUF2581) n=1 Tax=Dermatophilus congolensis TaxID=1863 RepID=A0A239VHI0_9MICO|nr:PH domain-containing protein [Dermatophilus congolensis]SNV21635.1 Protein of uncharacterised function (DUF2581) [Dermatophilus congolensis]
MRGKGEAVDPYATFRPVRGRWVPVVVSVIVFASFTFAAITIQGAEWKLVDRLFVFALGAGIAWFCSRFVGVRAVPTEQGLMVRNLFRKRRFEWTEILRVQFGGGGPWAYLDVMDGEVLETVAVMAIQKADGAKAIKEASRLSALVQFHSSAEPHRGAPEA